MRRIFAIARKEFIHITRDWRLMTAVLVMPLLQLFLFSYALSFDVRDIPTALLDADKTAASRDFVSALTNSGYFDVTGQIGSIGEVDGVFERGDARAIVLIKHGFAKDIASGGKGQVAVLIDGSEPNSAQLGQGYGVGLTQTFGRQVAVSWAEARGLNPASLGGIEPAARIWYNPEAKSSNFLIPGLMVVVIMIVTVQQTAVTLVKERDQGTLEQLLVSPLRRGELMLGKVLPWAVLAVADTVLISIAGIVVFGVPFRGDVALFSVAAALFVLCCLAFGLLISARASTPEVANLIALLVSFLPSFMLSDFVFPLRSIPVVLQWISYLFPGRYMVTVARTVFLKGGGWPILWPQVAALAVYAIVALTATSLAYRRRL